MALVFVFLAEVVVPLLDWRLHLVGDVVETRNAVLDFTGRAKWINNKVCLPSWSQRSEQLFYDIHPYVVVFLVVILETKLLLLQDWFRGVFKTDLLAQRWYLILRIAVQPCFFFEVFHRWFVRNLFFSFLLLHNLWFNILLLLFSYFLPE